MGGEFWLQSDFLSKPPLPTDGVCRSTKNFECPHQKFRGKNPVISIVLLFLLKFIFDQNLVIYCFKRKQDNKSNTWLYLSHSDQFWKRKTVVAVESWWRYKICNALQTNIVCRKKLNFIHLNVLWSQDTKFWKHDIYSGLWRFWT